MPSHPSEETAESNIFDKVAKGSSDSTASTHEMHKENEEPVKATGDDHRSKGPVVVDKLPEAEDKESLKAKAQEMNK